MPWDLSKPYYFAFGPEEDASEVKILNQNHHDALSTWEYTTKGLLPGKKRALEWRAPKSGRGDAWLFSRSFLMKGGKGYEAAIMYQLALDHGERLPEPSEHEVPMHQLTLRLGREQVPGAMKTTLVTWGVANTAPQTVRASFRAPDDGVYYFSIQAHSRGGLPGRVVLIANSGAPEGGDTTLLGRA